MYNIVAMSTICADVFEGTGEIRLGGEALNFAMNISDYSHIKVSLMGAIGDDYIGQTAAKCIQAKKAIDMSCVHVICGGKTATNKVYRDKTGNRYFKEDSWDGGVYQDFKMSTVDLEKLKNADVVFINYYSPNFDDVLELKEKYGYQLAVDFDVVRNFLKLQKFIQKIDYVFFSGDEHTLLALEDWSQIYQGIFNATLAENGSVTFYKGKRFNCEAVLSPKIIDTTGCGDSYHAAFLASYLKDKNINIAMKNASVVASNVLTFLGGFSEQVFIH